MDLLELINNISNTTQKTTDLMQQYINNNISYNEYIKKINKSEV